MDKTNNWFHDLFINEAKPALKRHSGSGGSTNPITEPITITENGFYPVPKGEGSLEFGTDWKFKDVITPEDFEAVVSHYTLNNAMAVTFIIDEATESGFMVQKVDLDTIMGATTYGIAYVLTNVGTDGTKCYVDVSLLTETGKTTLEQILRIPAKTGWQTQMGEAIDTVPTIPNVTADTGINTEYVAPLFDVETKSLDGWGDITVNVQNEILNIAYGDTAPEDTSKLWVKTAEPRKVAIGEPDITFGENHGFTHMLEQSPACPGEWLMHGAVIGSKIYYTPRSNSYNIYYFDTETKVHKRMPFSFPTYTHNGYIVAVGTNLYVFQGAGSSYRQYVWKVDTELETLSVVSTSLFAIEHLNTYGMSVAAVGDKVYFFGGGDNNHNASYFQTTIRLFDTATNTLTTLDAQLPSKVAFSTFGVIGTKIYILGGDKGGYVGTNHIWCFDTETQTIEVLPATLPQAVYWSPGGVISSRIYAFGTGKYSTIQSYDTETEVAMTLSTPMQPGLDGSRLDKYLASSVGNSVYIMGGYYTNFTNSYEVYKFGYEELISLAENNLQIVNSQIKNKFSLVNEDKYAINIGIDKVYKGNADGIGEEVDAALYNGTEWVNI